jgi:hypothetical protein
MNTDLTNINGLLCIDCWEDTALNDFYNQLESKINFSQFDSIIAANYELALDTKNDLSQHNVLEEYSWHAHNPEILLDFVTEARDRDAAKLLRDNYSSNSFLLLSINAFKHHVETMVPHVRNWLVIGGTWGMCTHSRPLSFSTLSTLDYNFYTAEWAVYSESSHPIDFDNDSLTWKKHHNGLYQLL